MVNERRLPGGRWLPLYPAIFLLCLFLYFYKLGDVGLFDVDEAVFSQATREMVEEGEMRT